jgi:hypothetical protein
MGLQDEGGMMMTSRLVFEDEAVPDGRRIRVTQFTGNDARILEIAASLRERGHLLEKAEGPIPGLWHIDGGPELTTNQMLGVARGLLTA